MSYGLIVCGWLGVVVCQLAANHGSNCLLMWAGDGCIVSALHIFWWNIWGSPVLENVTYSWKSLSNGLLHLYAYSTLHCILKNVSDIFDCNLKTRYQILIIFDTNIPLHNLPSNDHSVFHLTQCLFLHYLGKTQPVKYHFFIQCNMIA